MSLPPNKFSAILSKLLVLLFCTLFLFSCGHSSPSKRSKKYRSSHSKKTKRLPYSSQKGTGKVVKNYFSWPIRGEVSSEFGSRSGRFHDGIDIRSEPGRPVRASASGKVVFSGKFGSYGNLILIRHPNAYFTAYGHNSENLVREGDEVSKGSIIAKVGNTGNATGYHLHFEIRSGSRAMNPLFFLP